MATPQKPPVVQTGSLRPHGDPGVFEQPNSPVTEYSADGVICTRVYEAQDIKKLYAASPIIGSWYEDLPYYLKVSRVVIQPQVGKAVMIVELTQASTTVWTDGSSLVPGSQMVSVIWTGVDKDIKQHPIWQLGGLKQLGNTEDLLTTEFSKLSAWENENDATKKKTNYNGLGTNTKLLADRIKVGQDTYRVYQPQVRLSTRHYGSKPYTGGCGKKEANLAVAFGWPAGCTYPVSSGNNKLYTYIKMEDEVVRDPRAWCRTQTWIGFEQYDSLIVDNT
jgi:hypothetical protein